MTTKIEHMETTGQLVLGSRAHLMRPDLSNVTVCGRWNLNTVSDEVLATPVADDPTPCQVCHDPGWAGRTSRRHPATI